MTKGNIEFTSTTGAPQAIGPYSQAVAAGGVVYTAGQIALDPATMELVPGDVKAQTERVFSNLEAVLKASGSGLDQVLRMTVFLADMGDFQAMNEVYAQRMGSHRPARSTVAVRTLPRNALVEIDAIALVRG